jgi:hypothetical protein
MTFTGFAVALMERSQVRMKRAMEDLTDDQLYWQPAEGANSIGWLVWHLSRWKDIQTARVVGEPQVWVSEAWAGRFGMAEAAHGSGDGPADVAAFRAERTLLIGYADAAHEAALRRVGSATAEQLSNDTPSPTGGGAPGVGWSAILTNTIDYTEHTGQIAYLRGMI